VHDIIDDEKLVLDLLLDEKILVTQGTGFNWPALGTFKTRGQEKGHREEFVATVEAIQAGKSAPIPFSEIIEVTEACFTAVEQIRGV
jgi:aspartate/methionine/tyrosine aminotransferase